MRRLKSEEVNFIQQIWPAFYLQEKFSAKDSRLDAICMFQNFFHQNSSLFLTAQAQYDARGERMIFLDIMLIASTLHYSDFISTLCSQPNEVIHAIGIALSLIFSLQQHKFLIIKPILYNLLPEIRFQDIRSSMIGRFVSFRGYVIKLSLPQPYIICGIFQCNKCKFKNYHYFIEGIYSNPKSCSAVRCHSKTFEFIRSQVHTSEYNYHSKVFRPSPPTNR